MRKIKKFKIPIYSYDILRKAKKRKIDLFALGLADQESAKEYISSIAAAIEPSTVFDLLSPEEELAKKRIPANDGATTLGAMTLGPAFEEKLKAITDPELFRLAETAALVFTETGLKVISELIDQEVSAEGLELGETDLIFARPGPDTDGAPAAPAADPQTLTDCLTRLSADKIGISMNGSVLAPRYSVIFAIPWLAKKKKKTAAR